MQGPQPRPQQAMFSANDGDSRPDGNAGQAGTLRVFRAQEALTSRRLCPGLAPMPVSLGPAPSPPASEAESHCPLISPASWVPSPAKRCDGSEDAERNANPGWSPRRETEQRGSGEPETKCLVWGVEGGYPAPTPSPLWL